ncbi:MAG: adenosylcobinamide-GDP ribazoletransferase [Mycobacteriales bacterium]
MTGLRLAVALFTAVPLPGRVVEVDRRTAVRAVRWMPVLGAALGGAAGLVLVAAGAAARQPGGRLLGAVLAVTTLAALTRGLHLDGLADTADGLGSRAPAARALEIMRQSDIGPFGVIALVLVLLLQIGALYSLRPREAAGTLVLAATAGRLSVLLAAGTRIPAARPDGFGALVAGGVGRSTRVAYVGGVLALAAVVPGWAAGGGRVGAVRAAGALVAGLAAGEVLRRHAVRRLGGMTGDTFGALVETTTTAVLVALALRV